MRFGGPQPNRSLDAGTTVVSGGVLVVLGAKQKSQALFLANYGTWRPLEVVTVTCKGDEFNARGEMTEVPPCGHSAKACTD